MSHEDPNEAWSDEIQSLLDEGCELATAKRIVAAEAELGRLGVVLDPDTRAEFRAAMAAMPETIADVPRVQTVTESETALAPAPIPLPRVESVARRKKAT